MDLGQIEAFVQVTSQRSFSRAAEVIQLTQPSITARIQSLERDLGEELFERSGRGLRLTDAGQAFLPYAERVLQTIQEARDSVAEVRGIQAGMLQIGVVPTIGTYLLPEYLREFRDKFPGINVSVRTGRSEQVLGMVLNDDVHLGIVRSSNHRDVEVIPLFNDEIVLIVNPSHPFAREKKARLQDVAREPLILFERESSYFSLINELFRRVGTVPNRRLELDSLEATKRMVAEGLGVALVPSITIDQETQLGSLVKVDIEKHEPIIRPISVIHRKARRLPHTATAFLNLVTERYSPPLAV